MDGGLISARRQVELKDLMLSHARKWHGTTLIVPIVSLAGILINEENKINRTLSGKRTIVSTAPFP